MENNTVNAKYVPTPDTQIHLETLVTPTYAITAPVKDVMDVLDGMVNRYLTDTKSKLINVAQFGVEEVDEDNIVAYARLAVERPTANWIMDKLKDAPQEVQDILSKIPSDVLSQIPTALANAQQEGAKEEGNKDGNS